MIRVKGEQIDPFGGIVLFLTLQWLRGGRGRGGGIRQGCHGDGWGANEAAAQRT